MYRAELERHALDQAALATVSEAFDLALSDLKDRLTECNQAAVAASVAEAIVSLARAGQINVERLRVYGYSKGLLTAAA